MGRRATYVNHLAFSVAKVLQKETGTLAHWHTGTSAYSWVSARWPQNAVLLYQDLELRAKRSLSRLASRDFVMSGTFPPLPAK